jgi:Flp pilus assembly protein TadG
MNSQPRVEIARPLRSGARRRRHGNIAVIAALAAAPIIGAIGLGVDYTRLSLVKAEMQRGADAAALAGARIINAEGNNTADVTNDALMYFWANYRQNVADAAIVGGNPSVAILAPNYDTVKVVADARVPMAFGNFIGLSDKTIQVAASAQRAVAGMEVVLVLDNTGSMGGGTRMADLKSAAKDLVEILYGEAKTKSLQNCPIPGNPASCTTEYLLTVGVVPFITVVNVSPARGSGVRASGAIVDAAAITKENWGAGNSWKGCVRARPYPFEEGRADATPAESPFQPYIWKPTKSGDVNFWTAGSTVERWPTADAPLGRAADNRTSVGAGIGREIGPNAGCSQPLMPLQPSKDAALAQIDGMNVGEGYGTLVPIGLAWGWRVLSPDWRPYWSGRTLLFPGKNAVEVTTPPESPRNYGARNFEKVMVVFTDGENYLRLGSQANDCCMSAYGDPTQARAALGSDIYGEINRRMQETCSAIKGKGIKLYVVLLYPRAPQWLLDLYNEKGCASGKNTFFHASSESQLRGIFSTVGSQLKNLRLVQ